MAWRKGAKAPGRGGFPLPPLASGHETVTTNDGRLHVPRLVPCTLVGRRGPALGGGVLAIPWL
eukprot:2034658-Prymnesium_polylepis.1